MKQPGVSLSSAIIFRLDCHVMKVVACKIAAAVICFSFIFSLRKSEKAKTREGKAQIRGRIMLSDIYKLRLPVQTVILHIHYTRRRMHN